MQRHAPPLSTGQPSLWALLRTFSWPEIRLHPWRHAVAVLAIMLGVGLGLSVQLINGSALAEFSAAVRGVNGEPDARLRGALERLDDRWLDRVLAHPQVRTALPVIEVQGVVVLPDGSRLPVRLWGVDALALAVLRPDAALRVRDGGNRLDVLAPDAVFGNPAALAALGPTAERVDVQVGLQRWRWRVAGQVALPGVALLVMDVAALQERLGWWGQVSRLDLRLVPGADADAVWRDVQRAAPAAALQGVVWERPDDDGARLSQVSRAYRVNLTVLALVALFTGAFLVFSVLNLSVTQRLSAFALLGVLGLDARQRQRLVWAESALLGAVGSTLGVALGTALAWAAMRVLGGDLGGGYFAGVAPPLRWDGTAALGYGALGVAAALAGGWWPALTVRGLAPAQALKGVPMRATDRVSGAQAWSGPVLMVGGAALCLAPPVAGLPLGAYVGIAALLLGGILTLPVVVMAALTRLAPSAQRHGPALLALERARRYPGSAAVATSGVVASLALSVALTVMVGSFRQSMTAWLDAVLPADVYVRAAAGGRAAGTLSPAFIALVRQLPGVVRVEGQRQRLLTLDPRRPPVTVLARPLKDGTGRAGAPVPLPLVGPGLPWPTGPDAVAVFVSEAMADLYDMRLGAAIALPGLGPAGTRFVVAGVWRDYARQHGSLALDATDYVRLTGDGAVNDLAVFLDGRTGAEAVQRQLEAAAAGDLEVSSAQAIRQASLHSFDRSFAVTVWLQAVAIGMGLMGISASFSAQVLARRQEFGLLRHVGLSRTQVLGLVATEGALWSLLGAVAGVALGLAVSVVLVHVVNPQSFHWTMELALPAARLAALALAVVAAGTVTAWLSGRLAASRQAVLAVKEEA